MSLDLVPSGRALPDDFNVVIEIRAHSDPINYEVDKESGALFVDRFIGTSMHYPCNYGYIPRTLSDDGDPTDVLVVSPFAPAGYADGYRRAFSNRAEVLVRGRRAPVVGTVCMDLCLADVTDIPGAAVGDEVVLLGRRGGEQITADELAAHAGTISYEIFCGVGPRVPRLYRRGAAEYDGRAATAPGAGQG